MQLGAGGGVAAAAVIWRRGREGAHDGGCGGGVFEGVCEFVLGEAESRKDVDFWVEPVCKVFECVREGAGGCVDGEEEFEDEVGVVVEVAAVDPAAEGERGDESVDVDVGLAAEVYFGEEVGYAGFGEGCLCERDAEAVEEAGLAVGRAEEVCGFFDVGGGVESCVVGGAHLGV